MKIKVAIIRINSAVFVLYGIAFILFPESMSQYVTGTMPNSPSGLIDMRSTYGGMSLAFGIILHILSLNQESIRQGILAVIIMLLGMASGRVYGLFVDGPANPIMYIFLAYEIIFIILAYRALVRE